MMRPNGAGWVDLLSPAALGDLPTRFPATERCLPAHPHRQGPPRRGKPEPALASCAPPSASTPGHISSLHHRTSGGTHKV